MGGEAKRGMSNMEIKTLQISQINERIGIRSIKPKGVERLKAKISEVGYLPEKPVIVTPNGKGYILIDGAHRVAALEALGEDSVEALIDESLVTEAMRFRRGRLANEVSETVIPTTFVDDAELIWVLTGQGMTQTEIGGVLGWSREKVKNYNALKGISPESWEVIGTAFEGAVPTEENGSVPNNGTAVPFSENLLRQALSLTPDQQLELVSDLASARIDKRQFAKRASIYKTRNEIKAYIAEKCPGVSSDFLANRLSDIDQGGYDDDWSTESRSKIQQFIEAILDEWQQKSSAKLILGDFEAEVLTIDDGIIDLVLTDIPYNISNQGKVTKQGSVIVNASFDHEGDEWDTLPDEQYVGKVRLWVKEWERITKEGGSVISFCDKVFISDMWRIFAESGLLPKGIIVWEKVNPTPASSSRRNLISSVEFMIWGVKPGGSYTFNDSDNWNKQNVIHAPICGGNERIKDRNGETLHPTQKPLKVLLSLVEVFSNRGGMVFDGFMGSGSTGEAAKLLGRKFIGIERSQVYFNAAQKRLV